MFEFFTTLSRFNALREASALRMSSVAPESFNRVPNGPRASDVANHTDARADGHAVKRGRRKPLHRQPTENRVFTVGWSGRGLGVGIR